MATNNWPRATVRESIETPASRASGIEPGGNRRAQSASHFLNCPPHIVLSGLGLTASVSAPPGLIRRNRAGATNVAPLRGRRIPARGPSTLAWSRALCRPSSTMSPGRAWSSASSMARSRSGSTSTLAGVRCKPTSASLMILSGSSLRGLSAGQHDHVAHAARGFAHQRALAAIAVAAATEQRDDAAVGMQFARRRQQIRSASSVCA